MEAACECDHRRAPGRRSGDLHRVLDGLGARGEQDSLSQLRAARDDHPWVAVAGVEHGDAAGKIDEPAAFDVLKLGSVGAIDKDRLCGAPPPGHGVQPPRLQRSVRGQR
jgi:hypothetical protein